MMHIPQQCQKNPSTKRMTCNKHVGDAADNSEIILDETGDALEAWA